MKLAFSLVILLGCGSLATGPILGPDTAPLPLTLENLRGRWEEQAQIFVKVGLQTGRIVDTTAVPAADRIIYEFSGSGDGIVRRIQPDPGEAILRIDSPTVVSWVIGTFQSFAVDLSDLRLSLADGITVTHHFPGDNGPLNAQVTYVYRRVTVP